MKMLNLPQSMVMGHPVHAGLSPRMMGYSEIVKSPKVTFFLDTIMMFDCGFNEIAVEDMM